MQEQRYDELERRAAQPAENDIIRQLEARSRVRKVIDTMIESGDALTLSAEEEEMLRAFRRFKLRMRRDGETFKWQTRRPDGIQIVDQSAEIVHPQEA